MPDPVTTTPAQSFTQSPVAVEAEQHIDARTRGLVKAVAHLCYALAGAMKAFGKSLEEIYGLT